MNIGSVLASVKRLYLEAAPLIYYVEENPRYVDRMEPIITRLDELGMQGFTSVITLTEVLTLPMRTGQRALEAVYRDMLINSLSLQMIRVSVEIADQAARIRAKYNLRTPDALHIATALDVRCDAFLTNDNGLKRVNEIKILMLDDLELDDTTG